MPEFFKKVFYLLLLVFFNLSLIHAQYTFQKIIGDVEDEIGTAIIELDTAYVIGGYAFKSGRMDDIVLSMILKDNVTMPNATVAFYGFNTVGFSTSMDDHLWDMHYSKATGKVILLGDVSSTAALTNQDIGISKMDIDYGNYSVDWSNRYGEDGAGSAVNEIGRSVVQTSINEIVITGIRKDVGSSDTTGFIKLINPDGSINDSRNFDISGGSAGSCVIEDNAGNFVVTGYGHFGNNLNKRELIVMKFEPDLDYINGIYYSKAGVDMGTRVINTFDGGYLVVGTTTVSTRGKDILVLKLNSGLVEEWAGIYGGANKDYATDVVQTCDSGYAICGVSSDPGNVSEVKGNSDGFLMKINNKGNIQWSRVYGYDGTDGFRAMKRTSDGGYIMTGYAENASSGFGKHDIYVVKTNANGMLNDACPAIDTISFVSSISNSPPVNNLADNSNSGNYPLTAATMIPDTLLGFTNNIECTDTIGVLNINAGKNDTVCKGNSFILNEGERTISGGHRPYKINWSPGTLLDDSTIAHPVATLDTTTLFILEVRDGNCQVLYDSVRYFVGTASADWSGLDTTYCSADMLDILTPVDTGGMFIGPGVHYNGSFWYFRPSDPEPGMLHRVGYIDKFSCDTVWKETFIKEAPCVSDVVTDSTAGSVVEPQGIFTDCSGQIYLTDKNIIVRIDTFGHANIMVGDSTRSEYKDGHIDSALLNSPIGIAVASTGEVYFADNENHAIRMIRDDTVKTIAGDPPPVATAGSVFDTIGKDARFNLPFGLTLGPNEQYLYVSESNSISNNEILRIDLASGDYYVKKIAGGGALDVNQPRLGTEAKLYEMGHLTADADDLYITDYEKAVIYRYNFNSDSIYLFAGDYGNNSMLINGHRTNEAVLMEPVGLSMNCSGELYFADRFPSRIRKINNDTVFPYFDNSYGLNKPSDVSVFVKGFLDVANTKGKNILRLTISDWRVGPWIGLDTSDYTYCLGESQDTLRPIYPCGTYSGPGISYDTALGKYIFDPPDTIGIYTITYTYQVSYCTEEMSQDFRVVANPTLDIPPAAICSGDSAILDAQPQFIEYLWSNGEITQTIQVGDTGNYHVTVHDANHCSVTDTTRVTERVSPIAEAGASQTVCQGDSVQIGGSPAGTGGTAPLQFSWSPSVLLGDSTLANPYATPLAPSTLYVLTVTDAFNCQDVDSVTMNANPLPIADAGANDTICNGQSSTLDATGSTGTGSLTYSWNNGLGLGSVKNVSPNSTTSYILTVTDGIGCSDIDTVTVVVNPSITADAGMDAAICEQDTIQLGGSPPATGGTGAYSFSWTPAASLDNSSAPFPKAFPASTTTYQLIASDGVGCADTSTVTISVSNLTVDAGVPDTLCMGDTIQLNGMASNGITPYEFSWIPAGIVSDTAIDTPYAFPVSDTTFYLNVTDNIGCTALDSVNMFVNPIPVAVAGPDTSICGGESVTLTASGGVNYSWSPTSGLSDPNIANPVATPSDTTIYTVTVTDNAGCSDRASVSIHVNNVSVSLSPSPDTMICEGDSIQLTAQGGVSYAWSPAGGLSNTAIANPFAKPSMSTTYTVTVTDAINCTGSDTVRIIVSRNLTADAGTGDTICQGSSLNIGGSPPATGGISPYTYLWSPPGSLDDPLSGNPVASPMGLTHYVVTVTDLAGCENYDTVSVGIYSLPAADAGPNDSICYFDSVRIGGSPTASGTIAPYTYEWAPLNGLVNNDSANPVAKPVNFTDSVINIQYTVTVTDGHGCRQTDNMRLTALPKQRVMFTYDSVCRGESIQLSAIGGTDYTWMPAAGLNDPNISDPVATPDTLTRYVVTINSPYCGAQRDTTTIKVNPLPVVVAGPDTSVFWGEEVQLFATGGVLYEWSPKDDIITPDTIANPIIKPLDSTIYIVTVTNIYGCTARGNVEISAKKGLDIYVPSAFAPNGNVMENRELCVKEVGIAEIDLKIYNRWGQLVFHSTEMDNCWDGTYKGEKQQVQTFGYILKVVDYEGDQYTRKGTITIIK